MPFYEGDYDTSKSRRLILNLINIFKVNVCVVILYKTQVLIQGRTNVQSFIVRESCFDEQIILYCTQYVDV